MKKIKLIATVISIMFAVQFAQAQTISNLDNILETFKASLNKMFEGYLKIESALMQGNASDAGKAADELNKYVSTINSAGLTKDQLKIFNKQNGKILTNTEHIRDNAKNYEHQCEHFDFLTDEFYSLLKNFRFNTAPVYYNFTKDGNEANSAHWLTDKDEMKDPYFKGATRTGDKRIEVLQAKSAGVKQTTYYCSMHPDVTSNKPGTCPKCGMSLVEKK